MEQITKAILQLKAFLFNQFKDGFFNARVLNSEDISNPIVKAINGKKQEVLDPDEISNPIVSKLQEVISSIENKDVSNTDIILSLKELSGVFRDELSKIEMNVEAPVINLDQKELIQQIKESNTKLLDKLEKVLYNKKKEDKEEIDYTPILSDLCDLVEKAKPVINLQIIEDTLLDLLDKKLELPLEDDRVKVVLSDKQIEKLNQNQRIFLPGGVENKLGQKVNPATIEKQEEIITSINNQELLGNSSVDGTGDSNHAVVDDAGRLQTRGFRDSAGNGRRMLVDADRHGQVDVLSSTLPIGAATEANQDSIISNLQVIAGMNIPLHDTKVIDKTDPNNITITYKLSGATVATKTISTSGDVVTISI